MSKTRAEVFKAIERNGARLRALGVRRLQLFGSAARNEALPSSDLDFVVELENKSFDSYMDVKLFLEDLFDCHVDLVLAGAIKPQLRERILGETVDAPGF